MTTYHGEAMVWRYDEKESMLKMRGKAPRGRKHKRIQSRKMHEDGDETKESHGMQPHPRPTDKQTHAFSIGDGNKKRHKVQQVC